MRSIAQISCDVASLGDLAIETTKDEFLAMLGYAPRNPLAPIVSALELMNVKSEAEVTLRERAVIERQVRHVVRLSARRVKPGKSMRCSSC